MRFNIPPIPPITEEASSEEDFSLFPETPPPDYPSLEIGGDIPEFAPPTGFRYPRTDLELLERIDPRDAYVLDSVAKGVDKKNAIESISDKVKQGISIDEQIAKIKEDLARDIAGITLESEEYKKTQEELDRVAREEIPLPKKPPLESPTLAQGFAGALGAILFPEYATKVAATALEAPLKEQMEKYAMELDAYEKKQAARKERIAYLANRLSEIRAKDIARASMQEKALYKQAELEAAYWIKRLEREEAEEKRRFELFKMWNASLVESIEKGDPTAVQYYGRLLGMSDESLSAMIAEAERKRRFTEIEQMAGIGLKEAQARLTEEQAKQTAALTEPKAKELEAKARYKEEELALLRKYGAREKEAGIELKSAQALQARANAEKSIEEAAKARRAREIAEVTGFNLDTTTIDMLRILRDSIENLRKYRDSLSPLEDESEISKIDSLILSYQNEISEILGIKQENVNWNELMNLLKGISPAQRAKPKTSKEKAKASATLHGGKLVRKGKIRGKSYEVYIEK